MSDDSRVTIGSLLAGLLGGMAIAAQYQFTIEESLLDVLTAVGTCGAVIVAIVIALGQRRETRRQEVARARLHAASMVLRVKSFHEHLSGISSELFSASKFDCAPDKFRGLGVELRNLSMWQPAELEPLAALPKDCALKLAGALDRVHVVRDRLFQFAATAACHDGELRKQAAAYLFAHLDIARQLSFSAAAQLETAVYSYKAGFGNS